MLPKYEPALDRLSREELHHIKLLLHRRTGVSLGSRIRRNLRQTPSITMGDIVHILTTDASQVSHTALAKLFPQATLTPLLPHLPRALLATVHVRHRSLLPTPRMRAYTATPPPTVHDLTSSSISPDTLARDIADGAIYLESPCQEL